MEFKLSAKEAKSETRLPKAGRSGQKSVQISHTNNAVLEAITQINKAGVGVNGVVSHETEDGVLRMKLVVRKQQLKQMLDIVRDEKKLTCMHQRSTASSVSLGNKSLTGKQRLQLPWRRKFTRSGDRGAKDGPCARTWRPALQSIPEELQVVQSC